MIFVEEKQLRDQFWKMYGNRRSIIAHQFESQARHGGMDLVTAELVQDADGKDSMIQFCAFEFKLNDIKKALAQAEINIKFCHKSFIVIPAEKEKIVMERYKSWILEKRYIGVIGVELNGRWKLIIKPKTQWDENITLNQKILKMLAKQI